jgi:eukaryotic-like serine/threonine-protein kinase
MTQISVFRPKDSALPPSPEEAAGSKAPAEEDALLAFATECPATEAPSSEPVEPTRAPARPPAAARTGISPPAHTRATAPSPAIAAPKNTAPAASPARSETAGRTWLALLLMSLLVAAAIAGLTVLQSTRRALPVASAATAASGVAQFRSEPAGAAVIVDGEARGVTPLDVKLPEGQHVAEIRSGDSSRTLTFTVAGGSVASQYVEFAPAAAAGRLEISSDPPGAPVSVDGSAAGTTPLVLASIAPGPHTVIVGEGGGATRQSVNVTAGATASVVVSGSRGPAAGWATLHTPFDMQVFDENGQLIGSTAADRVMLTAGRHDLRLANATYGFETRLSVQITAGKTTTASVDVPNGMLSVNALPWANVSIDGRAVGTTPLGNLSVPVGSHEIVWRHPQLGERRQTVIVKAQGPTRVGIDLRSQP